MLKMFHRKGRETITKAKEERESQEVLVPLKPLQEPLSIEQLEKLFAESAVLSLDLSKLKLSLDDEKSLKIMRVVEQLGDPITLNDNWYSYRIPGSWARESFLYPDRFIPATYAFALPIKATRIIKELSDKIGTPNEAPIYFSAEPNKIFCRVYIASANGQLGSVEEAEEQSRPKADDPMLIVGVWFRGKQYSYCLTAWDLRLDLNLGEKEDA